LLDKKILLFSESSGFDIAGGAIPFLYKAKDNEIHELMESNLRNLTLSIRTTHPYTAFSYHTMQIESSLTAAREALEKVLPQGMSLEELTKRLLIVDNDSIVLLQQALRDEFRVRFRGNPAKIEGAKVLIDQMLTRLTINQVPLHEITREIADSVLMWDSKTAQLYTSPSIRDTMTSELEEANEKRSAYKYAWDLMRDEAKKDVDDRSWHKALLERMKSDAKLKVGISLFSANAALNLEKEHNENDDGAAHQLHAFRNQMKNSGQMEESSFTKAYSNFRGKDWARSTAGKVLRLQRVTNLNMLSLRKALVEYTERVSSGMLERITLLPLEPSASQQEDALREIELLRTELLSLRSQFEATQRRSLDQQAKTNSALIAENVSLKNEVVMANKRIDELSNNLENQITTNKRAHDQVMSIVFENFTAIRDGLRRTVEINDKAKEGAGGANGWWQRWYREQLPEFIAKIRTSP
jgi:hypothetical protein